MKRNGHKTRGSLSTAIAAIGLALTLCFSGACTRDLPAPARVTPAFPTTLAPQLLPTTAPISTAEPQATAVFASQPTAPPVETSSTVDSSPQTTTHLEEIARLGRGMVYATALSPDRSMLALGSVNGVYLIERESQALVTFLPAGAGWIDSLAWSPDGKRVAAIGMTPSPGDTKLLLWDVTTQDVLSSTTLGASTEPHSLVWSPSGDLLALCAKDVRVWDISTNEQQYALEEQWCKSAAWSPDGAWLATGRAVGSADQITLWRGAIGEPVRTLKFSQETLLESISWSPDSNLFVAGGIGHLQLWNTNTWEESEDHRLDDTSWYNFAGETSAAATPVSVQVQAWSSDSRFLAWGSLTGPIGVWEVAGEKGPRVLAGHTTQVTDLAWMTDNTRLISTSCSIGKADQSVREWDISNGQQLSVTRLPDHVSVLAVAWSPVRTVLATAESDGTVWLWDSESATEIAPLIGHGKRTAGLAWAPKEPLLASADRDGKIIIWDVLNQTSLTPIDPLNKAVYSLAWSPDGKTLAALDFFGGVHLWDTESWQERTSLSGAKPETFNLLAWSPDSTQLANGGTGNVVTIWDARSGKVTGSLTAERRNVTSLAWSPDGTSLAFGCGSEAFYATGDYALLEIWDIGSLSRKAMLEGHRDIIVDLAWSPDGTLLASAGIDGDLRLWDVAQQDELQVVDSDIVGGFAAVDWAPDENLLAWGRPDGTVRLLALRREDSE